MGKKRYYWELGGRILNFFMNCIISDTLCKALFILEFPIALHFIGIWSPYLFEIRKIIQVDRKKLG